jgi:hypothetical protein
VATNATSWLGRFLRGRLLPQLAYPVYQTFGTVSRRSVVGLDEASNIHKHYLDHLRSYNWTHTFISYAIDIPTTT